MSNFAEVKGGIVQRVIAAEQGFINSGAVGDSFLWVQCSYNGNFRKQYPGTGYTYDKVNDVFIMPQPHPSWALDASFDWQPPTVMPDDGKPYEWDEENTQWAEYN
jgi:hypothetical protein